MRRREVLLNSKVRRRLFSEDTPDKTGSGGNEKDHPSGMRKQQNVQKLYNEMVMKGMKWNFDFENETAMDGPIKWYKKTNTDEWVGMPPTDRINCTRDMDETENEPGNADERSHAAVLKHIALFADILPLDLAIIEGEQDNLINESISEFPLLTYGCKHWNFRDDLRRDPIAWCGENCLGDFLGLDDSWDQPHKNEFEQLPPEALSPEASELNTASTTSSLDLDENKVTNDIDMDKLRATELNTKDDETQADVSNVSNYVATENDNLLEEMKMDKTIELVKDENQNEDENLPKKHFENLKISENTEEKEDVEKVTDMKENNEATPSTSSNYPLHPKRKRLSAQPRPRNENVKRKRLLSRFE